MKVKYKNWVDKVERVRGELETRLDKTRLDKNERVSHFDKGFWNNIINSIQQEHVLSYPEVEPLYGKLAESLGISEEQILITAGSDFALKIGFELFINPGDKVIVIEPTFAMIDVYCKLYNAEKIIIGYDANLNLEIEKIFDSINQDVNLIIIANPNSPTGTYISNDILKDIAGKASEFSIPVIIDEAYYGFCPYTATDILEKFENLIITRTFSKTAGLAGLRAGYVISNKEIISLLYKFRPMYEINSIAVLFISELLDNWDIVEQYIKENNEGKKYLVDRMREIGMRTIDTSTNFIHVDLGKHRDEIVSRVRKKNILVKGGPGVKGFENYVRITTGDIASMMKVTEEIKRVIG